MAGPFLVRFAFAGDLKDFAKRKLGAAERGAMDGARRFRARAKLAFRAETRRALGDRVANAWRDSLYPGGGRVSLHPAVLVRSNAPEIIRGHSEGTPIRSRGGQWLAIPSEHVPRKSRRHMTLQQVETEFGRFVVQDGRAGTLLLFVNAIRAKSGRGFRRATRRRTRDGRENELVLMFVLKRQVSLRPVINWRRTAETLGATWRQYLAEGTSRGLEAA